MTTHYKTQAFVFQKNNINESDRIFSVFTNDFGRLDIFAKAIRKNVSKLRGGIDTFFISEIEFIQGKNKKTLTDAQVIEKFKDLTKDPGKFRIASRIGGILDNFIKGEEKDSNIFDLLNEVFYELCGSNMNIKKYELLYYYFLWNILSLLGYHIEVKKCAVCNEKLIPYSIYFSSKEGGIICKKCLYKDEFTEKINSDIVKILRIILLKDWMTLSKLKIEPYSQKLLKKISDDYYLYILSGNSFGNISRASIEVL